MLTNALRTNAIFPVSCVIAALICAQRGYGFWFGFFLLPAIPYQALRLALVWKQPVQRTGCLAALVVLAIASLIVYGAHKYHAAQARNDADQLIVLIEAYRVKTGDYPPTLDVIATVPHDALSYYRDKTPPFVPFAYYRDTFISFDKWIYDFKTKKWEFRPD